MRRRLDAELVRRGLARSRADAVAAVQTGRVVVAGVIASNPARQVGAEEAVHVRGAPPRFVSRAGAKLDAALDRFGVPVAGRRWLDAGASTGGFTDCLLQRGAREVVAVDVGRGQLAWSLREDPRVDVRDGTNVRRLRPEAIGGPVDATCADLAFISLAAVAPALRDCTAPDGDFVLLVKPQFEAGPVRVGKGGIVRDPTVHRAVLDEVVSGLATIDVGVQAVVASPINGAGGNREFLVHARRAPVRVTPAELAAVVGSPPPAGRRDQNGR